jgi:polyisoprenoid-binding protein YceI
MRFRFLCFLLPALFTTPALADRYTFDKSHSYINFYVNHLGFSEMMGRFTEYDGYFNYDEANPSASEMNFSLSAAGIHTSSEILDAKLQGSDFFDSSKYPDIRFVSTNIDITGENTADVTGNLTLRGIVKPVMLHVKLNKSGYSPVTSLYVAGFSATAIVRRSDFGMTTLLPDVGDDVRLDLSAEAINQTRKQAESIKK